MKDQVYLIHGAGAGDIGVAEQSEGQGVNQVRKRIILWTAEVL